VSGDLHKGVTSFDSVVVRQAPSDGAAIAAVFGVRSMMIGNVRHICRGFSYVTDTSLQHRMNAYATGVQGSMGMPVDSITSDSAWARVAYAIDTAFIVRHGWVSLQRSERYLSWINLLALAGDSSLIFFRDPSTRANAAAALRLSPDGPAARLRLPAEPGGWSMYLDRIEGEWGEVRIQIGDVCGDAEIRKVPGKFWVKLVDERGRPVVLLPNESIC
jgi:hypothetical protein